MIAAESGRPGPLIDLGELPPGTGAPPPPPAAPAPAVRRGWIAVVLVLVLVIGLGGGGRAESPLEPVADVPVAAGGVMLFDGTRMLVAEIRNGVNELTAYTLGTGRRLWTTRLTVLTHGANLSRAGHVALVSYSNDLVSGDLTNAVDIRTGRLLWHREARVLSISAGRPILTSRTGVAPSRVFAVDPKSGTAMWSRPVDPTCLIDAGVSFVQVCGQQVTVIELSTGGVAAGTIDNAPAPARPVRPGFPVPGQLAQADGAIVIAHYATGSRFVVEGFVADPSGGTIRRLWSHPDPSAAWYYGCGALICVQYNGGTVTPLSPDTGMPAPEPGLGDAGPHPRYLNGRSPDYALVAPGAGQTARGGYARAVPVPALGSENGAPMPLPGRAVEYLAALAEDGAMRIIDRISGIGPGSCLTWDRYLTCATAVDRVRVWRITRSGTIANSGE